MGRVHGVCLGCHGTGREGGLPEDGKPNPGKCYTGVGKCGACRGYGRNSKHARPRFVIKVTLHDGNTTQESKKFWRDEVDEMLRSHIDKESFQYVMHNYPVRFNENISLEAILFDNEKEINIEFCRDFKAAADLFRAYILALA